MRDLILEFRVPIKVGNNRPVATIGFASLKPPQQRTCLNASVNGHLRAFLTKETQVIQAVPSRSQSPRRNT